MSNLEQNSPENIEASRELTREELKEALSQLKKEYCFDLSDSLGINLIFPAGTTLAGQDFGGKSLEDAFSYLMAQLESYQSPIETQKFLNNNDQESKIEKDETPVWLQGHEELIWHGAIENPIWRVKDVQYDDKVVISYQRRNKELRPGKQKDEQGFNLESIKNSFTLAEWKVAKQIFQEYEAIEEKLDKSDDETEKNDLRQKIHAVFLEERAFKRPAKKKIFGLETGLEIDDVPEPKIIKQAVQDSLNKVARSSRGFKSESIDVNDLTQRVAEILSQIYYLNLLRGRNQDRVPKAKAEIKEIPSFKHSLKLLTECLANQLNYKNNDGAIQKNKSRGIALLIGEAGTGKNEMAEYFAAKTKRPFFWFPCGRGMEAIDLVTHYEFDSKEGTKRFMTDLAEGLQTPGALILIDEVNSLKPEVQAILHGLGDSNRSLNYDGVKIPVAEGALIVVAGNPATYGSAGDLGQALLSRVRGQSMVMDYPALTKGELIKREMMWSQSELTRKEQEDNNLRDFACDEVLVLYPQLNEFAGLNDQEFSLLWDVVINESTQSNKLQELDKNPKLKQLIGPGTSEHIRQTLKDLRDILRIADAWRKYYESRKGGFDILTTGMRDTIALVREYKNCRDVRKSFLKLFHDFVKNPIEGLDATYKYLEKLINDTLNSQSV